ncbi:hypothetical protein [Streptomyces sp. URMC 125]|uniref:hypothetical protein n=1 Tax=Streptomyces sp. URMC 125 TaxID=3423419 RepID=UPI003F1AE056
MTLSPLPAPDHRTDRTVPPLGAVPRQRPARQAAPEPRTGPARPALPDCGTDGDPPATGWLHPTGRVPAVLAAWGHGALAEVPTGIAWDVVRVPAELGPDTVRRLRAAGVRPGPVLATPLGADFVVAPGSVEGWSVAGTSVLSRGTLVLLPHPEAVGTRRVGNRGWLVAPDGDGTLTCAADLRDAYTEALAAEAAREAAASAESV